MGQNRNSQGSMKRKWSLIVLVFLCLTVVCALAYRGYIYYTIDREKSAFQKIEKDMEAVSARIKKEHRLAVIRKAKYCTNDQEKYGGGQLRCVNSVKLPQFSSQAALSAETASLRSMLGGSDFRERVALQTNLGFGRGQYEHTASGSDCYLGYNQTSGDPSQLDFEFYCIRKAYKAIFPML